MTQRGDDHRLGSRAGRQQQDGEALAIGRGNGNTAWNYERTCAHDLCPNGSTSSAGYVSTVMMDSLTHWVVMRFVFTSSTTTQITQWLDPVPGSTDPGNASALSLGGQQLVNVAGLHFNCVELGGQTARFAFDEIRLATTFAEVANNQALAVGAGPPAAATTLRAGPNPFLSMTRVRFALPASERAEVHVLLRRSGPATPPISSRVGGGTRMATRVPRGVAVSTRCRKNGSATVSWARTTGLANPSPPT